MAPPAEGGGRNLREGRSMNSEADGLGLRVLGWSRQSESFLLVAHLAGLGRVWSRVAAMLLLLPPPQQQMVLLPMMPPPGGGGGGLPPAGA